MKLSKLFASALLMSLVTVMGCSHYGFSGASIDYNVTRTLSISNFFNDSPGGLPNMGQLFTEKLKDYFQRNTKLELVPNSGDLQFEGSIVDYQVRPQAIVSSGSRNVSDQSGLMRVTIFVEVGFTNQAKDTDNFQRRFSFYADYDPQATTLNAVESQLVEEIFDQIIFDIFQASVAQW
uniref:LPS assembly lipoprotein LptE n=1 Tax=Roseivirga sp. TaxID=1964215 RepID=UPI004047520A